MEHLLHVQELRGGTRVIVSRPFTRAPRTGGGYLSTMKTSTWNVPRVLVGFDATRGRAVRRGAVSRYLRERGVEPMAIPRTHDRTGLSRNMSGRPPAG